MVGALVLLPVILLYTAWSYWVFAAKSKVRAGVAHH
jgi:cytochrome bd-type quinol oxidase subunit 2